MILDEDHLLEVVPAYSLSHVLLLLIKYLNNQDLQSAQCLDDVEIVSFDLFGSTNCRIYSLPSSVANPPTKDSTPFLHPIDTAPGYFEP